MAEVQDSSSTCGPFSDPDTSCIIDSLRPHLDHILSAAVSHNTALTYQKGLDSFCAFRSKYSLPALWPPPLHQIINFIAYLSANSCSHSTVRCYLSAISYQLQIQGKQDTTKAFIVKKLLEGLHRLNPSKDVRSPITLPLLSQITSILPHVCTNSYEVVLFTSAFQLAFFALLRVSEFTVTSKKSTPLSFSDISISESIITVTIRSSKTDQHFAGSTIHIDFNADTSNLFQSILQYFTIRPSIQGPLFCHLNSKPLTSYQFTSVLHKAIKFLGLDTSTFKSHSFRIGCATHMYSTGVPEEEIKAKGRWKSNAMYSYIRI